MYMKELLYQGIVKTIQLNRYKYYRDTDLSKAVNK